MRGWLAEIARHREPSSQISSYGKLQRQIEVFAEWLILPWDTDSAELFLDLRHRGVKIGSMDLKIACIARVHESIVLTRNTSDFSKVPGLKIENWIDG